MISKLALVSTCMYLYCVCVCVCMRACVRVYYCTGADCHVHVPYMFFLGNEEDCPQELQMADSCHRYDIKFTIITWWVAYSHYSLKKYYIGAA